MKELILLYWGCVFLMYLSQIYYPSENRMDKHGGCSFMWRKSDLFMILAIFWMTCFSFLRTDYNDTRNYVHFLETSESVKEFIQNGELWDLTSNPLSFLYQSFAHDHFNNYHVYFLFPALLSSFSAVKLLKHYSVNPALSMLIFFSIGTYVLYMAALKQAFAMFFLLLAIPYALDKKYIKFYILVFVAVLFHTHAFMFAVIPFLTAKPWGKTTWLTLMITVFIMLTYNTTMTAFMKLAQSLGALVAEDEVFDGHQINVIRVLVYWVPSLLALFFRSRLFYDSSKEENIFVNMSILSSFILSIGLIEGANLYARMAGYFEIAVALSLPWMIKKLFTVESAKFINILAGFLYFGYFVFEFTISKPFDSSYAAISLWQFFVELIH